MHLLNGVGRSKEADGGCRCTALRGLPLLVCPRGVEAVAASQSRPPTLHLNSGPPAWICQKLRELAQGRRSHPRECARLHPEAGIQARE